MSVDFESRLRAALAAHQPKRITVTGARAAAVLLPLVQASPPDLILTVRSEALPSHKGQISFPGGSIDPSDESAASAALRETQEEIGLSPEVVEIIGELETFPTYVSGYVVTPFVGWLKAQPDLRVNPAEVQEVIQVPVTELSDDIRREAGFNHDGRSYPTEAWVWHDHVIWGVTARIVRSFLVLLAEAGLVRAPSGAPWWERFENPS